MRRGRVGRLLACLGLAALAWSGPAVGARAQGCATCAQPCEGGVCQRFHCPPGLHHCQEQPPCIRIHCGCPRPVCNPCSLPNFGYFQTCWTPWPLPPDWSHCRTPPPAAFVQLQGPVGVPGMPSGYPGRPAPAPSTNQAMPLPSGSGTPEVPVPPAETEQMPRPAPFIQPGGPMNRPG